MIKSHDEEVITQASSLITPWHGREWTDEATKAAKIDLRCAYHYIVFLALCPGLICPSPTVYTV
ncbi:hypothetical protein BDV25DRAFT_156454 [Aspergillus avenaceus]|uniref:Uncharacterized protein n=1 Tax=Aspergillus avenaceus TaxID=36643 RepID=A0A5N6TSU0_ASPAV|nr:hypothetical protein BDV25DRAFT_156454 [Aspergillus avenaceus]